MSSKISQKYLLLMNVTYQKYPSCSRRISNAELHGLYFKKCWEHLLGFSPYNALCFYRVEKNRAFKCITLEFDCFPQIQIATQGKLAPRKVKRLLSFQRYFHASRLLRGIIPQAPLHLLDEDYLGQARVSQLPLCRFIPGQWLRGCASPTPPTSPPSTGRSSLWVLLQGPGEFCASQQLLNTSGLFP